MINIVFMGTPDFSVPTLTKLYNDPEIKVSYVVTKIDSKSSRGQKINFSCVKKKALELNIPILQPEKIKTDTDCIMKIKEAKPDFIIVVAYGQILSKEILDIPKFACINGHASLLPKYRGASPIQSAILNGDSITGTTTMLMDVGLDTGDILEQVKIDIDRKETSDTLFEKLSNITADAMLHTIKNFSSIKSIKQDETKVTKSVIIDKSNGLIDFKNEEASFIDRKIRAYTSWPSAFIKKDDDIIKIWDVDVLEKEPDLKDVKFYTDNLFYKNGELFAKCKAGYLRINVLQRSGKNKMSTRDFLNGLK